MNLQGSLSQTGYGYVTYNIARELVKLKSPLKIFPIGEPNLLTSELTNEVNHIIRESLYSGEKPHFNPSDSTLKVWHQHDLHTRVGNGLYMAFPFFELDKFTPQEVANLECPDLVLTSSKWSASILDDLCIAHKVVNPGVDPSIFFPCSKQESTYTFINIGKWEVRKGHDILIEAFNDAFTTKDDVKLIRVTAATSLYTRDELKQWSDIYKLSPLGHKIDIVHNVRNHNELASLINKAHCGVFPSRAEGWNLEILECMACGLDIIATNYSAHTEYVTNENSRLIECEKMELAKDNKFFFGQGRWMKFTNNNYEQLVEHLRNSYQNRKLNEEGIKTAQNFTWSKTIHQFSPCIS